MEEIIGKLEVYIEGTTNPIQPIDLEISAVDNKVWVSSTRDFSGNGGGGIWQSDDAGDNFTKKYQVVQNLILEEPKSKSLQIIQFGYFLQQETQTQ